MKFIMTNMTNRNNIKMIVWFVSKIMMVMFCLVFAIKTFLSKTRRKNTISDSFSYLLIGYSSFWIAENMISSTIIMGNFPFFTLLISHFGNFIFRTTSISFFSSFSFWTLSISSLNFCFSKHDYILTNKSYYVE